MKKIDVVDAVQHLVDNNICSEDEAYEYIEAEVAYYEENFFEEINSAKATVGAGDEPISLDAYVDSKEIKEYIIENTTLDEDVIDKIEREFKNYIDMIN